MPDELRLLLAFGLALGAALIATPLAIRLAYRTSFLDRPVGYKAHGRPTPYLGGLALAAACLPVAVVVGGGGSEYLAIVVGAAGLCVVGTVDDRVGLGPLVRVLAEALAAFLIWNAELGWSVFQSDLMNLLLTVVWVVGLVNAFNLMDNLDGATGTVGMVCAAGAAGAATVDHNVLLAALAVALCGACAGFLPYNLTRPSRVFLGDGGSMPVGFVVAAIVMAAPPHAGLGAAGVLAAAPLVGLPILDTTLVTFSRLRRGVNVLSGGRDHITHRLLRQLRSAHRVALVLGLTQAILCLEALALFDAATTTVLAAASAYLFAGAVVIMIFDWPPAAETAPTSALGAQVQQETTP